MSYDVSFQLYWYFSLNARQSKSGLTNFAHRAYHQGSPAFATVVLNKEDLDYSCSLIKFFCRCLVFFFLLRVILKVFWHGLLFGVLYLWTLAYTCCCMETCFLPFSALCWTVTLSNHCPRRNFFFHVHSLMWNIRYCITLVLSVLDVLWCTANCALKHRWVIDWFSSWNGFCCVKEPND